MYLTLNQMQNALGDDLTVRFREEIVGGRSVTIVSYMIANDELWNKPLGIEARGVTFDTESGDLISLPFEKFFNVNEKSFTQASLFGDAEITPLDKYDGSMITPVVINGEVFVKTKKSFYSDVAQAAQKNLPENVRDLCIFMSEMNATPIFEYMSPENKVVIDYGNDPKWTLLAARRHEDGEYVNLPSLAGIALVYGVDCVVKNPNDLESCQVHDVLLTAAQIEGVEGWVFQHEGKRYKVKTQWYLDRHRMLDVRERDIAELVLDEKLDDVMPNLIAANVDLEVVHQIEKEVILMLNTVYRVVERAGREAAAIKNKKERAEFVLKNYPRVQKMVFRAAINGDIDDRLVTQWVRDNNLKEFSLRSIGNPKFGNDPDA